jgi:hypothetical protein
VFYVDGACHAVEGIRTGGGWKIEREFSVQDELAVRLEVAASAEECDKLLGKGNAFVTDALLSGLAADQYRERWRAGPIKEAHCRKPRSLPLAVLTKITTK